MAPNYKVMEGARKNSQLYVFASKLYVVDKCKKKTEGKEKGKQDKSLIYLRCRDFRQGDGCGARAYIAEDKFFVTHPLHKCGVDRDYIKELQLKTTLKDAAEKGEKPFKQIYEEKTKEAGFSVPLPEVLSSMKKRRAFDLPPNVTKAADVVAFMEAGHPRWSHHYYKSVVHTTKTKKGRLNMLSSIRFMSKIIFGSCT